LRITVVKFNPDPDVAEIRTLPGSALLAVAEMPAAGAEKLAPSMKAVKTLLPVAPPGVVGLVFEVPHATLRLAATSNDDSRQGNARSRSPPRNEGGTHPVTPRRGAASWGAATHDGPDSAV
jgi:hypothetical protein